ncbi:MAG: HD domain-containing protein [Gammaproteobacteria bacterium]|nr:HD domain-containing protein [Gammaproteobacteria bacterium]
MGFVRVKKGELKIGESLAWSVYREDGTLLLQKGHEMESQHQIDMLIDLGFHQEGKADRLEVLLKKKIDDPFVYTEELHQQLISLLKNLTLPTADGGKRLQYVVKLLVRMCEEYSDAMIAEVHRLDIKPYSITHSLHTAILSALLALHCGIKDTSLQRIVSAALTANLGMLDLQDSLENYMGELTDEQREKINAHPDASAVILQANVTDDEQWLAMVAQHHENLDASGYPNGLQGEQILTGARIIAIADRYSAMVSKHVYHKQMRASAVLKLFFQDKGSTLDEDLCLKFIHLMGVFPPGSFVQLENSECAIVTAHSHNKNQHWPLVSSYKGMDGHFYISPLKRDTNLSQYKIKCMIDNEQIPFSNSSIWGYDDL